MSGFFQKIKEGLIRFMDGRHGPDQLSVVINYGGLLFFILGLIPHLGLLSYVGWALFIWSLYRMFSRNNARRNLENQAFLTKINPYVMRGRQARARFQNRKTTSYFRCPKCKSWLKTPRGVGSVTVTCGKCGEKIQHKA